MKNKLTMPTEQTKTSKKQWLIPLVFAIIVTIIGVVFIFKPSLSDVTPSAITSSIAPPPTHFKLKISINPMKANASKWDLDGSPPDAAGQITYNGGKFLGTIDKRQDRYSFIAGPFKTKAFKDVGFKNMKFCLSDRDLPFHDKMGCVTFKTFANKESVNNDNFTATILFPEDI